MANWPALGSIVLPNVGGWLNGYYFSGQYSRQDGKSWYAQLNKPKLCPPDWIFGPVWTTLYAGMGYASYLVWRECDGFTEDAMLPLSLYGGQLILNWTWTPLFMGLHDLKLAFIELVVLTGAAAATAGAFYKVHPTAGLLLAPYVAWLSFASWLNYSIWKLNPKEPKIIELKDDEKKM